MAMALGGVWSEAYKSGPAAKHPDAVKSNQGDGGREVGRQRG